MTDWYCEECGAGQHVGVAGGWVRVSGPGDRGGQAIEFSPQGYLSTAVDHGTSRVLVHLAGGTLVLAMARGTKVTVTPEAVARAVARATGEQQ